MNRITRYAPAALLALAATALAVHGPIHQAELYHAFADTRALFGIANAADVLSNAGFLLVALWGLWCLRTPQARRALGQAAPGYLLFVVALLLTAFGSAFYHLAPDNQRLYWDRLPIALACAGLLAGTYADTHANVRSMGLAAGLGVFGWLSVTWWSSSGDLRPYLMLQLSPLVIIPLWQALHHSPARDRIAIGVAILFYIVAKVSEVADHAIYDAIGVVSGHTIKHLLAVGASAVIVGNLVGRTSSASAEGSRNGSFAPSLWDLERLGGRGGP